MTGFIALKPTASSKFPSGMRVFGKGYFNVLPFTIFTPHIITHKIYIIDSKKIVSYILKKILP